MKQTANMKTYTA